MFKNIVVSYEIKTSRPKHCALVKRPAVELESYRKIFHRLRSPIQPGHRWTDKKVPEYPNYFGLNEDICGIPALDVERAVIHGEDAPERAWPWQVFIRGEERMCSGVLISESWVVTVAHCFNGTKVMLLGQTDLERWTPDAVARGAELEIPHEGYNRNTKYHDIGLIKMNRAVVFSRAVRPICILRSPPGDFIYPDHCYASGYGMTKPKVKVVSNRLQQLSVTIMPHTYCRFLWSLKNIIIHSGHTCLDFNLTAPSAGVCNGDSGSPLNCKINGRYFLFGMGSFVEKGCEKELLPDVYTRVNDYLDWINKTIAKHS